MSVGGASGVTAASGNSSSTNEDTVSQQLALAALALTLTVASSSIGEFAVYQGDWGGGMTDDIMIT